MDGMASWSGEKKDSSEVKFVDFPPAPTKRSFPPFPHADGDGI
jgi:hypothetical protein